MAGAVALLAALAGAALVAPAPAARAANVASPIVSGLAWRSGSAGEDDLGAFRGRPLDLRHVFIGHRTWTEMFDKSASSYFAKSCNERPLCVVSFAMFPDNVRYQFQACANGAFDASYRRIAQNIAAARRTGGLVVRIGWEANGPPSRPWHIRSAADVAPYKACFARIAGIVRQARPGVLIDWSNAKKGRLPGNVMDTYPGDAVVDIIAVHYYDSGPRKQTQAIWDDYAHRTRNGGPWGIETWVAEAKKRGKKLGVPEWGVWAGNGEPGNPDNPVYIANMFRFFARHAADIAYESYHNMGGPRHNLFPRTQFPRARTEYQRLW